MVTIISIIIIIISAILPNVPETELLELNDVTVAVGVAKLGEYNIR